MHLKTYHPIPKFPPISLSGTQCQLSCRHCNREYLRGMAPAMTPETLVQTCRDLRDKGAIGVLLSGGSTRDGGILNLREMREAIQQAKAETGLILNIHPGLMDEATVQALRGAIDFVSLEIPSTEIIRDVFGLDATTEAYIDTSHRMRAAGMNVMPHITVFDGTEDELLRPLTSCAHPEVIVVIIFTPTRDTPMAEVAAPTPEMVRGVISRVKAMFPETEISMGCMRPRRRELRLALELAALDAGVARMELPTQQTLDIARERGYTIERFDACCALPTALEAVASVS
jgi:hypothetical protein